jgi:hypothetical protein
VSVSIYRTSVHYCPLPTPGMPTWVRRSLCGVLGRVGYLEEVDGTERNGEPMGPGCSRQSEVTCPECREMANVERRLEG